MLVCENMCKFCKKWEQQNKLTSVVEEFTSYYLVYAEKTQQTILKISKETILYMKTTSMPFKQKCKLTN